MELDSRFEGVVDLAARTAGQALADAGPEQTNLPPFAIIQLTTGELRPVFVTFDGSPQWDALHAHLLRRLRKDQRVFSVAATCGAGKFQRTDTGEVVQAVLVRVEEPGGLAQTVVLPIAMGLYYGSLLMHEMEVLEGERQIFL